MGSIARIQDINRISGTYTSETGIPDQLSLCVKLEHLPRYNCELNTSSKSYSSNQLIQLSDIQPLAKMLNVRCYSSVHYISTSTDSNGDVNGSSYSYYESNYRTTISSSPSSIGVHTIDFDEQYKIKPESPEDYCEVTGFLIVITCPYIVYSSVSLQPSDVMELTYLDVIDENYDSTNLTYGKLNLPNNIVTDGEIFNHINQNNDSIFYPESANTDENIYSHAFALYIGNIPNSTWHKFNYHIILKLEDNEGYPIKSRYDMCFRINRLK